jgi:hypothetical protein
MKFTLNNFVMKNYIMDYQVMLICEDEAIHDYVIELTSPYIA